MTLKTEPQKRKYPSDFKEICAILKSNNKEAKQMKDDDTSNELSSCAVPSDQTIVLDGAKGVDSECMIIQVPVNESVTYAEKNIKPEIIDNSDIEDSEMRDNILINLLLSDESDDEDCETASNHFLNQTIINVLKKTMDKAQNQMYFALLSKNKYIEKLEKDYINLKEQYNDQIKIKKEVMNEDLERNRKDYDSKIKNRDEEQEYLIEDIKGKEKELKTSSLLIKDLTEKLEKAEKKIQELSKLKSENEKALSKVERLENRIAFISKKKPLKSEVDSKLLKAESELELMRNEIWKKDDDMGKQKENVEKLEEQKYRLENKLQDLQMEVKKKDEQKRFLDNELIEQKDYYEKEVKELHVRTKELQEKSSALLFENASISKQMSESDKKLKSKSLRIKELESCLSKSGTMLNEEKANKDKHAVLIKQMSESSKVAEEYKLDLESKIEELQNQMKKLECDHNSVLLEDIRIITESKEQINNLEDKVIGLKTSIESLKAEKNFLETKLVSKEQEHITFQIIASEKDELISQKNKSIDKLKIKNEKLKSKVIETTELKNGLDNRITITEMKYFNLEKDLSSKQREMKVLIEEYKEKIEKLELEKSQLDEKHQKMKSLMLQQVNLIRKKSGGKIVL